MTSDKTTLEILTAARAKIAEGWTQGSFARDMFGAPVGWDKPEATGFCTLGALRTAFPDFDATMSNHPYQHAIMHVAWFAGCMSYEVINWNDRRDRTQAQVLEVFDKAIAYATAREEAIRQQVAA